MMRIHPLLLAALLAGCGAEAPAPPPSPARLRTAEVVALISSGDRDAARDFIDRHYSDSLRDSKPTGIHLQTLSRNHVLSKGLRLVEVIERASGEDYYDYMRKHVFLPAGMRSTAFHTRERVPPSVAIGYANDYERPGVYFSHRGELPFRGTPAGGGYSTAADLVRFAEALRTGRLVSPAMVRVLTTPKPELGSPSYGFGFMIDPRGGMVGHTGGFPGVANFVDLTLEDGYTAVVLSNQPDAAVLIAERMRDALRGPAPPL